MLKKVIISLLVGLFLIACESPSTEGSKNVSFEKTKWTLMSYGRTRMAVPKKAFISFEDGRYSGYAGCNGMGGKYEVSGDKISFSAGLSTLMACPDMRLETKFRQEMGKVDSFVVEGNSLNLKSKDRSVLIFIAK